MAKHRRASKAARYATLAGITGAAIAAPLMTATSANAATQSQWDTVAQCESGGNWSINTGNGFYGGLQFTSSTWAAYGGTQFAAEANQATQAQQIQIGEKVLASQGKGAWPVCGTGLSSTPYSGGSSSSSSGSSSSSDNTDNTASAQTEKTAPAPKHSAPATPAPAAPSAPAPSHKGHGTYTVKPGDTLSGIAQAHGVSGGWQKLFQLNEDIIKDANLIFPGQLLSLS